MQKIVMVPRSLQNQQMNKLIGKYELIDYTMVNSEGVKSKWPGEQEGSLEYYKDGIVVVRIERQAKSDTESLSTADKKKLHISYKAKYDIISNNQISHTIIESNHPERVGRLLIRSYVLDEKLLTISGKGLSGDIEIIWEKEST